jgi:hypothetical protein
MSELTYLALYPAVAEEFCLELERLEHDADCLAPSGAEFLIASTFTFTPRGWFHGLVHGTCEEIAAHVHCTFYVVTAHIKILRNLLRGCVTPAYSGQCVLSFHISHDLH